jgi:hypothetical protein
MTGPSLALSRFRSTLVRCVCKWPKRSTAGRPISRVRTSRPSIPVTVRRSKIPPGAPALRHLAGQREPVSSDYLRLSERNAQGAFGSAPCPM